MEPDVGPELSFEERHRLKRFARPLNLIFCGGLLLVLNFNLFVQVGGQRKSIDLLPDAMGFGLIAAGIAILAFGNYFSGLYDLVLTAVAVLFAAFFVGSASTWFTPALEHLAPWAVTFFGVVGGLALAALSFAMRSVALEYRLAGLAKGWWAVALLFVISSTVPPLLGLVPSFANAVYLFAIPLAVLKLVAFVYLFVLTFQMQRVASGAIKTRRTTRGTI